MTATECPRIGDQIVDVHTDGGVVAGDDRTRTDADNDFERDAVPEQVPQDTEVCGTA